MALGFKQQHRQGRRVWEGPLHRCWLKPEAGWDGSGRPLTARSQRNREGKRKWERRKGQEKECEKEATDAKDCGKKAVNSKKCFRAVK